MPNQGLDGATQHGGTATQPSLELTQPDNEQHPTALGAQLRVLETTTAPQDSAPAVITTDVHGSIALGSVL